MSSAESSRAKKAKTINSNIEDLHPLRVHVLNKLAFVLAPEAFMPKYYAFVPK